MKLNRGFAAVLLAASVAGAVFAQRPSGHDDQAISTAVQEALDDAPSLAGARITVRIREGYVTLSEYLPNGTKTANIILRKARPGARTLWEGEMANTTDERRFTITLQKQ